MAADPRPVARHAAGWLVPLALVAVLFMAVKAYHAYDVWHHIRCGWYAWNQGPARSEPFSCTGKVLRLPWLQYEWLAQILIYLSHETLGVNGTILAKALLYAASFALLALACRRRGARPEAVAVAIVVSALAVSQRFYVRPGAFSFVAFGYLLWAIDRARAGKGRIMWSLPVLFALWANLHGAYVAGWAVLGMAAAGRFIDRRLGRLPEPPRLSPMLRRTGVLLALCVLAVLVNPYHVRILEVPLKLSRSEVVRGTINEWKPFTADLWLSVHNLFVPVLLAACVARWRRLRAADVLTVLAFGYLAVSARRHVSLMAFVTAPIAAQHLSPFFDWLRRRVPAWAIQSALCVLCGASVFMAHGLRLSTLKLGVDPSKYPEMAGEFLELARIDGHLFNGYADGNYLMWRRYPHNLVFVDGRIDTYGAKVMRYWNEVQRAEKPGVAAKYFSQSFVTEGWGPVLRRFDVTACVVRFKADEDAKRLDDNPPTNPLVDALWEHPDWALVFWDDIVVIFVRRDRLAGRHEYLTRPDTFAASRLRSAQAWTAAVRDLEHRIGLGDRFDCATVRVSMANALQVRRRHEQALPHLRRALELQSHEAGRAYNLAACLLRLNRVVEASKHFRLALRLGSKEPEKTWNGLGYCHLELRNHAEALRCFDRALKANPGYVFAHLSRSLAYERLGDRVAAVDAVRQALAADPENAAARQRLKALQQQKAP